MEQKIKSYKSVLSEYQTEKAIAAVKLYFPAQLSKKLALTKVEAPLLVTQGTGINDDLNGIESPVSVKIKALPKASVEIVQSLAKWKRLKLARLKASVGEGLYADMKALRPDEELSDVHSIYVDQWDWEKVIQKSDRNIKYLKKTVKSIYEVILETESICLSLYPELKRFLPREITFIHSEELLQQYPALSPKERENEICKEKGALFIIGIGVTLQMEKSMTAERPTTMTG